MKRFLFNFSLLFFVFSVSFSQAQNLMKPEDLWKLGRVSDPQVSPNGKEVLYNVKKYDLDANKGSSHIWKVNLVTGNATQLTSGLSEWNAKWNTNGSRIFYLSSEGGTTCLWSMMPDGSSSTQEIKQDADINAYGISGNGTMIWLAMDVKVTNTARDLHPDLPKSTGRVYNDLMYRHWDRWDDGTYSHIFIGSFSNGKITSTLTDIMKGEAFDCPMKPMDGEEQVSWRPDGKMLAYTCKKLSGREYAISTNSDIYLYDVDKQSTVNLTEGAPGYDKNPSYSPDGKMLLWMSQKDAGHEADKQRIFLKEMATSKIKEITKSFDFDVEQTAWDKAGKKVYLRSGVQGTVQVFVYDPNASRSIRKITHDEADHTELSVSSDSAGDILVTSRMTMTQPSELYQVNANTGDARQITFTNKEVLAGIKSAKVERRRIKATDGKDILTWIIYPPNFDVNKRYPTLLYCQGGPQSTVSQFFSYRWNFSLMAANGYVVVAPNRRGLPSFGEAWNDQISEDWGGQCMQDLLSAIDSVSKEAFIDTNKIGAVGPSFGGYSVYWLAGNHHKRFKAFIAHDGVFNFESMYGATEELWFPDHEFGGPYWTIPKKKSYLKFSPHQFVDNWDTPILIITNEKDYRVPYEQGLEAFTAARIKKIPARLLTFPDENHWVLKPQNSVLWQRVFFDWLDIYLKH